MTLHTAIITLIFVMNPLGSIPMFAPLLRRYSEKKRLVILLRESVFALLILVAFLFGGHYLLDAMSLSNASLTVAGGIILLIIAMRMIFPSKDKGDSQDTEELFIVPIATPLIAGPSALAWVMMIGTQGASYSTSPFAIVLIAWVISTTVLMLGFAFSRYIGKRGLLALERLMGMLLTVMAIQMLLSGIAQFYLIHLVPA
jgi:multiple antibiotic resistance protein